MKIDPETWKRVKALAFDAMQLEPDAWPRFLETRCGEDPRVREAVRSLLDAHREVASTFLDVRLWQDGPSPAEFGRTAAPATTPGALIGPYRILRKIGEGGMGEVWLAEQHEPLRRQVALKLIKLGMDTRQVLARFEAERHALALMEHPNVARVLDAGATDQGRPYFTMEYVEGEPITSYCDSRQLSVAQRIELFIHVCDGVQHAHQKGIIHRDIKPGNILVTTTSGAAVPKIIDFGVAKATQQRLTEQSLFTQMGLVIGTPAYMSPEQAEMTPLDIDTRTDIYSLGVVLYELLVGQLPFAGEVGLPEIQRRIREEDAPRPSARVSGPEPESEHRLRVRRTTSASLRRQLRGGLDWIVMTAMSRDRNRRYGTGTELALDLRRFLDHRPLVAGPPSTVYRLRTFVRRNRTGVAAAAVVLLALLFGLVAEEVRRSQAEAARREAVLQAEIANTVVNFVTADLLGSVDPDKAQGRDITVREVFDAAAAKFEGRFVDQPHVDAQLSQTFGDVYVRLMKPADARPHLDRALELRRRLFGESSLEVAETLASLAMCGYMTGPQDFAQSIAYAEQALAIRERLLGPDAILTNTIRGLLAMYRAVASGKAASGFDSPMLVVVLGNIRNKGETPEEVRAWGEQLILKAERLWGGGRQDEARTMLFEELGPFMMNEIYAEQIPFALAGFANRAIAEGLPNTAELAATVALEFGRERLGEGHRYTLFAAKVLAEIKERRGDLKAAATLVEYLLPTVERVLGSENHETIGAYTRLARLYTAQGRMEDAERLYGVALPIAHRVLAEDELARRALLWGYGRFLVRRERYGEAEKLLLDAWPVEERSDSPHLKRTAIEVLVELYERWGKPARATEWRARLQAD